MATLTITKTYLTGNVLTETDLDNVKNSVETFLNVTKINDDNIQTGGISATKIANNTLTGTQMSTTLTVPGSLATTTTLAVGTTLTIGSGGPTLSNSSGNLSLAAGAWLVVNGSAGAGGILAALSGSSRTLQVSNIAGTSAFPIVVSAAPATHGLMLVRGFVASTGSITSGEGFTVNKTGTGVYVITFSQAFHTEPACLATSGSSGGLGASAGTPSTTQVTVYTISDVGTPADQAFHFLAIGQRGA